MADKLHLDYYYGTQAEQFSFFRIPRLLIKEDRFRVLSSDSKLLYGLMLDRMSLSMKNEWIDEANRAYIIYTVNNIMEDLCCSKTKAVKLLSELSAIGLIEKFNRGLGLPAIIYVKNFATPVDNSDDFQQELKPAEVDEVVVEEPANALNSTEVQKMDFKKSNNQTSRSPIIEPQEVQKLDLQKSNNRNSRSSKIEPQEVRKMDPNYTDYNQTEFSDIELSYQPTDLVQSIPPSAHSIDRRSDEEYYRDTIAANIRLDWLKADALKAKGVAKQKKGLRMVDEIYEIICDMVCFPRERVCIRGTNYPWENVKTRYLALDNRAVSSVMKRILEGDLNIRQVKPSLTSAMYAK